MPTPSDLGADDLFRRYGSMVQRALRQLGVEPAALDDAAQDVFLVLHRRALDLDRGRSVPNWLWGIARGVASTYRRTRRRRVRLHETIPRRQVLAPVVTPDEHLARARARQALRRFLDSLDEDKCAVFVMAEIEGRTGKEIAAQLGVNINTVYARLRAARQRFSDALERERREYRPRLAAFWAWPSSLFSQTAMATATYAVATVSLVPQVQIQPTDLPTISVGVTEVEAETRAARRSRKRLGAAKVVIGSIDDVELIEEDPMKPATFVAALALTTAAPAIAQAKPKPAAPVSDQDADAAAQVAPQDGADRRFIFDGDLVGGENLSPDGTLLLQRVSLRHGSLIRVRQHFMPELIGLAKDI